MLEVEKPLAPLLAESFSSVATILVQGDQVPSFDFHCPLGSLPLAFDTHPTSIPSTQAAYLIPPVDHKQRWQARLSSYASPRIGLVWAGNPLNANDRNRSLSLGPLDTILSLPQLQFFSLQKDRSAADLSLLAKYPNLVDLAPDLMDFCDTAAAIENLDLVISVDTSVAHLAGALGCPVWILIPFAPDWRWGLEGSTSAWYSSARLFRQHAPSDWSQALASIATELSRPRARLAR